MASDLPSAARVAQMVGITGSLFLSGAISSISFITIPALLESPPATRILLQQWSSVFFKGAARAPAAAALACVSYGYATYAQTKHGKDWRLSTLAGVLTIAIVPFTIIFMSKTNNRLLAGAAGALVTSTDEARSLLTKWVRLNAIRSLLPLVGGIVGFCNLLA
ncbi:hypothetical protein PVAG01_10134 [Phlyctema vagabunda]|uniref:Uncharacterized protein n=1 Tax=Phlyctema vagabunda TaxID=108571 RepID=A0ABR4P555_9HELO